MVRIEAIIPMMEVRITPKARYAKKGLLKIAPKIPPTNNTYNPRIKPIIPARIPRMRVTVLDITVRRGIEVFKS
jgi:hypothetical protein